MSSFSSILASLGANSQTNTTAISTPAQQAKKPPIPTPAPARPPPARIVPPVSLKRKAEDAGIGSPAARESPNNIKTPFKKPDNKTVSSQVKLQESRPAQNVNTKTLAAATSQPAAISTQSQKPPPKGSFREILARAEAAKAKQSEFGQIKHKPVEKLSSKERLQAKGDRTKFDSSSKNPSSIKARTQGKSKTEASAPKKKKPLDLGYQGTMRQSSSQPAYTGTMRQSSSAPNRSTGGPSGRAGQAKGSGLAPNASRYRYVEESEDEEEDDESDMEAAGFDELEEEEQQSLRAAKKEDEEALRQENEHRQQKAEKRKKLEQLAASRRV